MSVQTSSGGSAGDKHFVDTVGTWTSTETEDPHLSVTIFQQDTNNIAGTTTDINTRLQHGLSNLITKMGYAPIKLYQYYKITSFEASLTDIDYGTTYEAETQMWNRWMAPWKNTPYQAASTFGSIYPNYLLGCVWKNFTAPSIGSKVDSTDSSSSNSQVLYLKVIDSIFEMAVSNPNSTTINGKQMNSTFVPTYTSSGLDNTTWGSILQRMKRQSGATARPNPM